MDDKLQEEIRLIDAFGPIIDELKSLLNAPNYFISEHVDKLINKIDIRREELCQDIHKFSSEMINQLSTFRDECYKEQLQNGKELIEKYQAELEIIEKQIEYWKDELNESKIDQERVGKLVEETKSSLVEFKEKPFDLKNKLLKGKGFYFFSNNLKYISKDFGELLFDEFKTIDLFETYQYAAFPFESKILS